MPERSQPFQRTLSPGSVCLVLAWLVALLSVSCIHPTFAFCQQTFKPTDPIASIDGDPIFLGELNYLLASKLRVKDVSAVNLDVQRASCALLVRQHLAMKSLRQQGGQELQTMLDRGWNEFVGEVRRKGLTIEKYSKQLKCDEQAVRRSRDWDMAWRGYLKSTMTESNLKRFYQRHADKYASTKWRVSHIFVPVDVDDDGADVAELGEQRIIEIASRLKSQSDSMSELELQFAELAISESDGATAKDGGNIGWVSKPGDLPTAVMDAIRQTPAGKITQAIKSPLGFHLVLVHEKSTQDVAYEKLPELNKLRRDAADALFDALVMRQSQAKVAWYIKQLQPPPTK